MDKKKVVSWALYDWANSAFATTIVAGFFPVFFKSYWAGELSATDSTFWLGTANAGASVVVAFFAPVVGAIADRGSAKKRFLFFFATMGIVMTGSLVFVAEGAWPLAVLLYAVANIGWASGNSVYDALLVSVAPRERMDFVSAAGFAIGYLGGGVLFTLNVFMVQSPETFGFADKATAVQVSFVSVALWWALFSVPVFLFVPEPAVPQPVKGLAAIRSGFTQLIETFKHIRSLKTVATFLVGYWLYIDGVDTIIKMAVDYGLSLGFTDASLLTALLVTQFVGFPAALIYGKVAEKIGTRRGLYFGLLVYVGVCVWAWRMDSEWEFYTLAVTVGLVQGGVQALSRSFYARLIPEDKSAEFFGFYNMIGKYAAILGPVLMGWVGVLTGSPRTGILSLVLLLGAGAFFLARVPDEPTPDVPDGADVG